MLITPALSVGDRSNVSKHLRVNGVLVIIKPGHRCKLVLLRPNQDNINQHLWNSCSLPPFETFLFLAFKATMIKLSSYLPNCSLLVSSSCSFSSASLLNSEVPQGSSALESLLYIHANSNLILSHGFKYQLHANDSNLSLAHISALISNIQLPTLCIYRHLQFNVFNIVRLFPPKSVSHQS